MWVTEYFCLYGDIFFPDEGESLYSLLMVRNLILGYNYLAICLDTSMVKLLG